jgi:protein gp37
MAAAARWSDLAGTPRNGKPWLDGMPRIVFVGDMADTLSRSIPFGYLASEVVETVRSELGRRHVWLWFTKRPRIMARFADFLDGRGTPWPANLVPVTSATDSFSLDLRGIGPLDRNMAYIPARWRALSLEPLRGPVELAKFGAWWRFVDWVILGGDSRDRSAPLDPDWVRSVRDECGRRRVPFFFKQWGTVRPGALLDNDTWTEVPDFEKGGENA